MTKEEIKKRYDAGQGVSSVLALLRFEVGLGMTLTDAYKVLKGWDNDSKFSETKGT
jgi:hypothetical protein